MVWGRLACSGFRVFSVYGVYGLRCSGFRAFGVFERLGFRTIQVLGSLGFRV